MTGHGRALVETDRLQVVAEVRTVNNRFLKTSIHCDLGAALQSQLEGLIKQYLNRGSVQLRVKHQWVRDHSHYRLDLAALQAYRDQLSQLDGGGEVDWSALLSLPGVIQENLGDDDLEEAWPVIQQAVEVALERLNEMRDSEGAATSRDLAGHCVAIREHLAIIEARAPATITEYADKATERINQLLQAQGVSIEPGSIAREVGLFAERVDISEEIFRLGNHVDRFLEILEASDSQGRKLDFLTQEMLRETNTIGSKASDTEIAGEVIEIKTRVEKIREQVQNVE